VSEHNSEDSFDKVKKDLKKTAEGFEDTAEGVKEGFEDSEKGVKEGFEDTAEGVKEGFEDSEKGVKETAKATTGKDSNTESYKEMENKGLNNGGGKDRLEDMTKKSSENLREAKEKIEQRTSKFVDAENSSEFAKKTGAGARTVLRNPIVILLIIAVIAIVIILLLFNSSNESKNENFSALWNQSLADLRSGNMTVGEYCVGPVHDEDFCNRLKDLDYMN
jgi:hypothetical protein